MASRNMETYLKLTQAAEFASDLTSDKSRDAMLAAFTPDFEIHEPPSLPQGGVFKGKEQWLVLQEMMRTRWQQKVLIDHMWDLPDEDKIILYTTMEWTANDTGKVASFPAVEVLHFRDHLIAKVEMFFWDTNIILDTLKK